ncbi:hypothetical protein F4823DRAFT_634366 [Ustulina deusta]|nr:hypothetical protein F4823DRAFT_634366 [Ustulina deusta]
MEEDSTNSVFHFAARPRDAKCRNQPLHPGKFEQFMRKSVSVFRHNPPGPSQYDKDEDRYKSTHEAAKEDLEKILIAHDEDSEIAVKAKGCSWDTVFEQMAEAARLKSSQTNPSLFLPAGVQIASEIIDIFPDDFGLGVIKGGLALIFEAAQRRSENRDKILEAFETVPDVIITINTAYLLLNPEEDDIDTRKKFFATLLSDLPFLIQKLLGKEAWYKKIGSALLLYIPEELAIDDVLSGWASQVANLKERVENMKLKILSKLGLKIEDLKQQIQESEANVTDQIKSSSDALRDQVVSSETSIVTLLSHSKELQQLMMTQMQRIEQRFEDFCRSQIPNYFADQASNAAMTGLIREAQQIKEGWKKRADEWKRKEEGWDQERGQFHRELEHSHRTEAQLRREGELYRLEYSKLYVQARDFSRQVSSQSLHDQAHGAARANASITPMQLMGAIGVPVETAWRDLNRVTQQSTNFDAESQGKARWLLKTPEFGAWFRGRQSTILLADGAATGHIQLVSPMSSFCATLAGSLIYDNTGTITLTFFVGLHAGTDRTDRDLDGPQGMMRCLIAQLLSSSLLTPNLEFLSPEHLEACRHHDLKYLCHVFVGLVEQLPPEIDVLCIIDGISWYEQAPWLTGLRTAVGMFEHLAEKIDPSNAGILKVLMTSPGISTAVVNRTREAGKRRFWGHVTLAAGHVHVH